MIYPKSNKRRSVISLNGIWEYKPVDENYEPKERGEGCTPMAVPASVNDITTQTQVRDHVGKFLFEREFSVPEEESGSYRLRIGAASHKCDVYVNGEKIGSGINGYYPIDLPLNALKEKNRLSVVIDNRLDYHTFPMGRLDPAEELLFGSSSIGKVKVHAPQHSGFRQVINHDFYNFTGIHRDVMVYHLPEQPIEDVTVETVVGGDYKRVRASVVTQGKILSYTVYDGEKEVARSQDGELRVEQPVLWSHENPHLYTLKVETQTDVYEQSFGIRKVSYDEKGLYLNGERIYLKGFGMHEDSFILGKGNSGAVNVRNFELLKWTNANCIRTSHYPYSEEIMDLADRYGILVIDEAPAVGVNHWAPYTFGKNRADEKTQALHKELLKQLWERDKNHPCVVMMSVANEAATFEKASREYFAELITYTRELTSLPVTMPEETKFDDGNYCADLVDFISLNRYFGWYDEIGDLTAVEPIYRYEVGSYYGKYKKPIIIAEFGADTIEGLHSVTDLAFTEEYQKNLIQESCRVFDDMPYVVGEFVWNFADFKTKQGTIRVRGNRKGVFTKEREPKAAAFYLKERWKQLKKD